MYFVSRRRSTEVTEYPIGCSLAHPMRFGDIPSPGDRRGRIGLRRTVPALQGLAAVRAERLALVRREAGVGGFADQLALGLGECGHEVDHELGAGSPGITALGERADAYPARVHRRSNPTLIVSDHSAATTVCDASHHGIDFPDRKSAIKIYDDRPDRPIVAPDKPVRQLGWLEVTFAHTERSVSRGLTWL